jgi:phosphoribosylformylglycinamidine cyclo-ligase
MSEYISYKDAGVNIDEGNALVDTIKPLASATKRVGADTNLGGFGGLFDLKACGYEDPVLVSATDGVGTKLNLAFTTNQHHTVGIDLVAMCVNDLVVQGAEPLFFLDYFATGALENHVAADVIKGIAQGCKESGCALIGGETAEMPGLYSNGHYDLAGFAVGAVERNKILPNAQISAGDKIIGLQSSGIHSNGFSLVRRLIEHHGLSYEDKAPFDNNKTLGEALLTPTKLYVKSCLEAIKKHPVSALAHITGGGFLENIPRVLPENLGAEINISSWTPPAVYQWINDLGSVKTEEMFRTFNCGIGMTLVVAEKHAQETCDTLRSSGEEASIIGEIVSRETTEAVTLSHTEESIWN